MLLNSSSATEGECTRIGFSSLFFRKDFEFWNQNGSEIRTFVNQERKIMGKIVRRTGKIWQIFP